MERILSSIDRALYRMGYTHSDVRSLVRNQILIVTASSIGCMAAAGMKPWGWSFAAGAVLITLNFFSLAKFGQHVVSMTSKGAIASVLVRFYLRLGLTGVALFALVVWAGASVTALLAGISTIVANFVCWAIARYAGSNVKEA